MVLGIKKQRIKVFGHFHSLLNTLPMNRIVLLENSKSIFGWSKKLQPKITSYLHVGELKSCTLRGVNICVGVNLKNRQEQNKGRNEKIEETV